MAELQAAIEDANKHLKGTGELLSAVPLLRGSYIGLKADRLHQQTRMNDDDGGSCEMENNRQ